VSSCVSQSKNLHSKMWRFKQTAFVVTVVHGTCHRKAATFCITPTLHLSNDAVNVILCWKKGQGSLDVFDCLHEERLSHFNGLFSKISLRFSVSFKTFTAVVVQVEVLWVVTPCSVVIGYQRFRGPCYLHLHWIVTPCSVVLRYQRFGGPCCLRFQGEVILISIFVTLDS